MRGEGQANLERLLMIGVLMIEASGRAGDSGGTFGCVRGSLSKPAASSKWIRLLTAQRFQASPPKGGSMTLTHRLWQCQSGATLCAPALAQAKWALHRKILVHSVASHAWGRRVSQAPVLHRPENRRSPLGKPQPSGRLS